MELNSLDIQYYSSDISKFSTLLICQPDGKINFIDNNRICTDINTNDNIRKGIRFYPSEDYLFTTIDLTYGLRVWDRETGKIIFSYKRDQIISHEYSKYGIAACATEAGIKLYDLRYRYPIKFIKISGCTGLEWTDEHLKCITRKGVICYDIKTMKEVDHIVINGLIDYKTCTYGSYCTVQNDKICLIKNGEYYEKECKGRKLVMYDKEKVMTTYENKIKIYSFEKDKSIIFDKLKKIEGAICGEKEIYIFGDGKLFFVNKNDL
ncbi:hypothetical protein TCON_0866 [Astathelohania contejeani]|uniref:Uncharacterized protein n=1 Tax=Astathelohania contejeani TaxID=164912 RepID=A0ABQ7I0H4_9MICR|nr:hypothetical protein TCON_0866 [Thelohania contejeani]